MIESTITRIDSPDSLRIAQVDAREKFYPGVIRIGVGSDTCGLASGAGEVLDAIVEAVREHEFDFEVIPTGCIGFCEAEPLLDVLVPGIPRLIYHHMTPEKGCQLVEALGRGEWCRDMILMRIDHDSLITDVPRKLDKLPPELKDVTPMSEFPFYVRQMRIALRNCGYVDPRNIDDYLATGGYSGLCKVLMSMSPDEIIDEINASGLRGRGGGGFPAGRKWRACRKAVGYPKYVLCNGDEGDPGAFMDRSIMESNPHSVLEGMLIGAYAIGSDRGYIYVRLEYPLAIKNLRIAIGQAQERGLLGKNILGTDFSFSVQISRGAGAFVCGESTALMASIEGFPGTPRVKHIHTSEKGLFGKPTNLNNVETWANVPPIINEGSAWFSGIGTAESKGTKVFSLVGKINNTGLVEVPMGISLRQIIYDIGGGVPKGRVFKAVQTGGPSGGCLPESMLDLPVDFDQLTKVGSMMGSGGMIVMDDRTCMVEISRYFTDFLRKESCGKCTPCREGTQRMYEILERITDGLGDLEDIEQMEELCEYVRDTSICGLGKSAPNPTLSTLRYFRDEYLAHIEGKCPAGVCPALTKFIVAPDLCKTCGVCVENCPTGAISGGKKKTPAKIDDEKCVSCGICRNLCKFDAIVTE